MRHFRNRPRARVLAFVYGTLRPGASMDAGRYFGARYRGPATLDAFALYAGAGFPAIVPGDACDVVRGDVYACDRATLRALDAYECAPILYRRERVTVSTSRGPRRAFVYVYATTPTLPRWVRMESANGAPAEWTARRGADARAVASRTYNAWDALSWSDGIALDDAPASRRSWDDAPADDRDDPDAFDAWTRTRGDDDPADVRRAIERATRGGRS